jgi:hypothetical protein
VTLHSETQPLTFREARQNLHNCASLQVWIIIQKRENGVTQAVLCRLIYNVETNIDVSYLLSETIRNVPFTQPILTRNLNVAFWLAGFVTGALSGRSTDTARR